MKKNNYFFRPTLLVSVTARSCQWNPDSVYNADVRYTEGAFRTEQRLFCEAGLTLIHLRRHLLLLKYIVKIMAHIYQDQTKSNLDPSKTIGTFTKLTRTIQPNFIWKHCWWSWKVIHRITWEQTPNFDIFRWNVCCSSLKESS